jgi:hypothetical protein|tara:strand:+ start:1422 stop:1583 length:162 start_codon:yes stop_codon:yes gene_type:complete
MDRRGIGAIDPLRGVWGTIVGLLCANAGIESKKVLNNSAPRADIRTTIVKVDS